MSNAAPVTIDYYSDMLCVWAYIGHRRVEELAAQFGAQIAIRTRYCSVFSNVPDKIEQRWGARGGYDGYADHVTEIADAHPHAPVDSGVWRSVRPSSSASAHLFLKAVEIAERARPEQAGLPYLERLSSRAAWALRQRFFAQGEDIADWRVHSAVAADLGLDYDAIRAPACMAHAAAALAFDFDLTRRDGVEGSPTFVMNNGRQKLFGNVGYRLLEANVQELLRPGAADAKSWC